jgi:hypothetical protein
MRNEAALPIYELTQQFATLAALPPEMLELFAALRHDQEQTNRFFGAIAGTVPVAEFFAPESVASITRASAAV